jgi:Arc/MetJ family transcription regulator
MNLDEELLRQASEATGIKEKTALVHKGLETLIQDAAIQRLIALGGTMKEAKAGPRKRPWNRK